MPTPAGVFGAATSDRIWHKNSPPQANLHPMTLWCWCFATTLTNGRTMLSTSSTETVVDTSGFRNIGIRSTGAVQFSSDWTTTNPLARSSTGAGNVITTNVWWFVAGGLMADGVPKVFIGQLGTNVAEVAAYATQTTGVGTPYTDAGGWIKTGNDAGNASAFQGRIAWAGIDAREPKLDWLVQRQKYPWKPDPVTTLFLSRPMFYGRGPQPDLIGNATPGTIVGATVGDGMPEEYHDERQVSRFLRWLDTVAAAPDQLHPSLYQRQTRTPGRLERASYGR